MEAKLIDSKRMDSKQQYWDGEKLSNVKVSDFMTYQPECVQGNLKISEAAEQLFELDVRHLPVVDGEELIGIISDRDFLVAKIKEEHLPITGDFDLDDRDVSAIMHSEPYAVTAETSLTELIDLMVEQKLSAVPVVDAQQAVIGIVSYIDILKTLRARI